MRYCITNPITNIPVNKKSHVYGWSLHWSELLDANIEHTCSEKINEYEVVYIDHGANFNGSLNLFGGLTEDVYRKFNNLMCANEVMSLDIKMPDYGEMFKKRLNAKSTSHFITESWCNKVSEFCQSIETLCHKNVDYTGITIGDSHSIAFSKKGDLINKMDGKTMYSQLIMPMHKYLNNINLSKLKRITMCFGSIDIRHHIIRLNTDVTKLVMPYIAQCQVLQDTFNIPVEIAAPVPVEYEGRRIPKSGFYDHQPFHGTIKQRQNITAMTIKLLKDNFNKVVTPPMDWYFMDPEEYAKTKMELNSSVHIAPINYRRNNWGENA
jgi:hypothetical protein